MIEPTPRDPIEEQVLLAQRAPERFPSFRAIGRRAGVDTKTLAGWLQDRYHLGPAQWLQLARLRAASKLLEQHACDWPAVGEAVGFSGPRRFAAAFTRRFGVHPLVYANPQGRPQLELTLPLHYRPDAQRSLLQRDADSPTQGVRGQTMWKTLVLAGQPARMEIHFKQSRALLRLTTSRTPSPALIREGIEAGAQLLGLGYARPSARILGRSPWVRLPGRHPGYYPASYVEPFEALTWAIVGQQINLKFAARLIRRLTLLLSGRRAVTLMPGPAQLAALDPTTLRSLQLSAAKSETLIRVSRAMVTGELNLSQLAENGIGALKQGLTRFKGIGPWTAEYVALRGFGFADCLPLGDSGLAAGVQRALTLDRRPSHAEICNFTSAFKPYRTLATYFLWRGAI